MDIVVNVITYNKSVKGIISIYNSIGIKGDAVFCNQCGKNTKEEIIVNGNKVSIFNYDDVGVSKNRNHVLDNAQGDISINIDDDCSLVDNYEEIIKKFFAEHPDVKIVQFNGFLPKEEKKVFNKKTKRIVKFNDISSSGGPGLVYITDYLKNLGVRYNEKIGVPNYVYSGEDSLFLSKIAKKRNRFYRCEKILFSVDEDIDNSTYYKGVDEQHCFTKGVGSYLQHPRVFLFYIPYYIYKIKRFRDCKLSYWTITKYYLKGLRNAKKYK